MPLDRPDSDDTKPSTLEEEAMLDCLKAWFMDDQRHSSKWRTEAREDFDFVANEQWSPEDRQALINQQRVPITFNRVLTLIKAVAGMEINGRHEISYIPRETSDSATNEVLSGASKWMADNCDGEDEESAAFQHALICGLGFNEHRMDYEGDASGMYVEECIDPLEMYWDRTAAKKNLVDARRMWRVRKMPLGDAKGMFPDVEDDDLDAKWVLGQESDETQKTLEEKRVRDDNTSYRNLDRKEVTIVHAQWWEREEYYLVADPTTNTKAQLSAQQYRTLSERMKILGLQLQAVKLTRKVYKQAFVGAKVLDCGQGPIKDQFSWTCITGEKHHNRRTWFGLVRPLRDPQMWSNKLLTQSLHIMNSTAKGGIIAETGAFEDQKQAEENYAMPQGIVWAARGTLSNTSGGPKIMPKPGQGDPSNYIRLMEFGIDALRTVSGINLELIGLKDVNQPGVLEAQRKQAGMTVLATMFDSLRRARKITGRIRLYFIQNFLSDGRLMRITGPDGAKVIPLIRDKCLGEYDVVVDDTPTSPNQKEANWGIILSILPAFKDQLVQRPDLLAMLMEYSPLPSKVVEALKKALMTPDQTQQQMQQLTIAGKVADISKDQAQAELFQKQAGSTEATAMYDMAMAQNLILKHRGDMVKAAMEWQKTQQDAQQSGLDAEHKAAQIDTERATADNIRAKTAGEHMSTHAARVGAIIDALHPIPHHEDAYPKPQPAGAP